MVLLFRIRVRDEKIKVLNLIDVTDVLHSWHNRMRQQTILTRSRLEKISG